MHDVKTGHFIYPDIQCWGEGKIHFLAPILSQTAKFAKKKGVPRSRCPMTPTLIFFKIISSFYF